MTEIINFITENWELIIGIIVSIYELIIRIKPTIKSKSIFNWLAIIFDRVIPNRSVGGQTFKLETKEPNLH